MFNCLKLILIIHIVSSEIWREQMKNDAKSTAKLFFSKICFDKSQAARKNNWTDFALNQMKL